MSASDLTPLEILHRLVGFDSGTPSGVNALLDFAADYLDTHRIPVRLIPTAGGLTGALIATIGPLDKPGGTALMGHADTAQVDQREWAVSPLDLVVNDGAACGLGVANMKGFISVLLARAPDIVLRRPGEPIRLIIGTSPGFCDSITDSIAREIQLPLVDVDNVVLGYPTNMRVACSHKALHQLVTAVRGSAAHSAHRQIGVNAVWLAAHLIDYIETMQGEAKHFPSTVEELDPPWTTLSVTGMDTHNARSTVNASASFEWEIRAIPELRAEELISQFKRYSEAMTHELTASAPRVQIETATTSRLPAFRVDEHSYISELLSELANTQPVGAVPFATEAAGIQSTGRSVAVIGPGTMRYAGTPRESISLTSLSECSSLIFSLLDALENEHSEKTTSGRLPGLVKT